MPFYSSDRLLGTRGDNFPTYLQALKTLAFWVYAVASAWEALFMTAVVFHRTSIGETWKMSRSQCYAVFPVIGLVSVLAVVAGGVLSDRMRLRWLLWVC